MVSIIPRLSESQVTSTYNFLKLDAGARAAALGGSFSSSADDANSMFYNPAAISTITKTRGKVGFNKYLLDINGGTAAYNQKLGKSGYFGGAIKYLNYGSFEQYDENSISQGTFSANDLALVLGYSNIYVDNFHYGANLKFIYSNIGEYSSTALAADLGVQYIIPSSMWNISLSLLNMGAQLSKYGNVTEDLPIDLRAGVSKKLEHLPLRVYFEFDNLASGEDDFFERLANISVGGEFEISKNVDLRIGYNNSERQDLKTGSSLGIAGFSAGLGIRFIENYSLDYSFNSMGNIGSTHRIDVGFDLK
jgi:hypothetical protein